MAGEASSLPGWVNPAINLGTSVVSGFGNVYGNRGKRRAYESVAKGSEELSGRVGEQGQAQIADLVAMYGPELAANPQLAAKYFGDVQNLDLSQYDVEGPGDFEFDYAAETEAQMNPYLNDIVAAATGDVEQSAANAGKLFSGAAGKEIARSTYDLRAKEYGNAANRAMQMGQQKYAQFNDKFRNVLSANEMNRNNQLQGIQATQGAYNLSSQGRDTVSTGKQNITTNMNAQQNQLLADAMAARAKKQATPGGFAAFAQGFGSTPSTEL